MNIIAFIMGIMMIFAITTNALLKQKSLKDVQTKSFCGHIQASREALNKAQRAFYKKIPKAKKIKKPNEKKKGNPKTRSINSFNAKINVYSLLNESIEDNYIAYAILKGMIYTLYKDKSFYFENFEDILIKQIIKAFNKQKQKDPDIYISNLFFNDDSLQKIYYKILKGSKFYDFEKKQGIASLLDFIKYENTKAQPAIKDASFELLTSIFGKKIAKQIQNWQMEYALQNLTKENILDLCQKNSFNCKEEFLDFFTFTHSSKLPSKITVFGIDENTQIKIKRNINF